MSKQSKSIPSLPRLIGLGGYAFAGKDAAADILETQHGWARTFMSKPLRDALLALDPLVPVHQVWEATPEGMTLVNHYGHDNTAAVNPKELVYIRYRDLFEAVGYDESKHNTEVRRLLQMLGTEVGRQLLGEQVWIDIAMREIAALHAAGQNTVITGIRYRNELEAIRAAGGTNVWVHRPGFSPVNEHSSDNALHPDEFDLLLCNDGSLDDLAMAVGHLVQYEPLAA